MIYDLFDYCKTFRNSYSHEYMLQIIPRVLMFWWSDDP